MIKRQQQYKVVIEQDSDGYFVASVPALPGCVTQAKTLSQLNQRVREAIELCHDVARTDPSYRRRIKAFAYEPTFVGLDIVGV